VTHLHHPPIFTPDAVPAASLPIYPVLGQAPNMFAHIRNGLVSCSVACRVIYTTNATETVALVVLAVTAAATAAVKSVSVKTVSCVESWLSL